MPGTDYLLSNKKTMCFNLPFVAVIRSGHDPKSKTVEMYHAGTPEEVKQPYIVKELATEESCIRLLICTIALGMGVNCKGMCECIHFGPSQNIEN